MTVYCRPSEARRAYLIDAWGEVDGEARYQREVEAFAAYADALNDYAARRSTGA